MRSMTLQSNTTVTSCSESEYIVYDLMVSTTLVWYDCLHKNIGVCKVYVVIIKPTQCCFKELAALLQQYYVYLVILMKTMHYEILIGKKIFKKWMNYGRLTSHVCVEQDTSLTYHVEMYESTPFIELMFQATIPLLCPGCVLTIPIVEHVGLTMSNCSFTLLSDTYTVLRIRAVPTAGRNARIVSLEFGAIDATGSPWDQFQLHRILVYWKHFLLFQLFTLYELCLWI